MGPKERAAYAVLVIACLFIVGYVGEGYLHKPPDIVFEAPGKAGPPQPTPGGTVDQTEVVVHVVGKVKTPGVVHLPTGSRVEDAIAKAGGPAADADLEQLNLAAKLIDGTQVSVPTRGSRTDAGPALDPSYQGGANGPGQAPAHSSSRSGAKPEPAPGSVSLNGSDAAGLQALPGVGPATADRILEYRKAHGRFSSVDELLAVKGIGAKKLEKLRKYLRL